MIRVVYRWSINNFFSFLQRQIIRNRNGFVVRNDPCVLGLCGGRPTAHSGRETWLLKIDGALAAEIMFASVVRKFFFMGTPSHFRRLGAFSGKPVDRPGVDEFAYLLRYGRLLRIALGDMNDLDTEVMRKLCPRLLRRRNVYRETRIGGDIQERLLDEVGNETRVRSVCEYRSRTRPRERKETEVECPLPGRIIRTR